MDKIHIGIASHLKRKSGLLQAVDSLYDENYQFHLYLNDYKTIPSELKKPNIKVYLGTKRKEGNLADKGKFSTQRCRNSERLTSCLPSSRIEGNSGLLEGVPPCICQIYYRNKWKSTHIIK